MSDTLAKLRALEAAASSRPWTVAYYAHSDVNAPDGGMVATVDEDGREEDAAFIAAARNALGPLLDALEALQLAVRYAEPAMSSNDAFCDAVEAAGAALARLEGGG